MQVAILGAGPEGCQLASVWARAGLDVILASADPSHARDVTRSCVLEPHGLHGPRWQLKGSVHYATYAQAATTAQMLVLCVPYATARRIVEEVLRPLKSRIGKVIIDATSLTGSRKCIPKDCKMCSALLLHRRALGDKNAKWAAAFVNSPPNAVLGSGQVVSICGNPQAKALITWAIQQYGGRPVDRGGFEFTSQPVPAEIPLSSRFRYLQAQSPAQNDLQAEISTFSGAVSGAGSQPQKQQKPKLPKMAQKYMDQAAQKIEDVQKQST